MRSCARTFRPDTQRRRPGDDSARHKTAIVRNVCIIVASQG
jgi:hypothetical protein